MYTETEKSKPKSQFLQFLVIVGYALGLIVLSRVCDALKEVYGIRIAVFVPYFAALALVWHIYQTKIIEYNYSLQNGSLVLERAFSRQRKNVMAEIALTRIISFEPFDGKNKPKLYCALPSSAHPMLVRFTSKDGKENSAVFSPSGKLTARLRDLLSGGADISATYENQSQRQKDSSAQEE